MDSVMEELISYLNLIYRLSVIENADKTQGMVQCIVNHIRYKYMRKEEVVRLKTEMLQVDNLIHIFRARFGDNLAYSKTVREDLTDIYLPSNTVLKLAESALFRGLIHKDGDWKLNIDVDENEQGLFIRVADNGVGLAAKAPPGSVSERRDDIEAAEAILKGYFTGMQPVNISCSGTYNRVTILIPRSE